MRTAAVAFSLLLLVGLARPADAAPEVVVAIRYLQAQGTSHAHLFLYRENGKLLRQLTNDDRVQDRSPIFAPGGEVIVWKREKAAGAVEFWSIEPTGNNAKRLGAPPDWYAHAQESPCFTNYEPSAESDSATAEPSASETPSPPTYRAPDGSVELVLRTIPGEEEGEVDGPGHGKHFLLRDLRANQEIELGTLPGFEGLWDTLHLKRSLETRFLFDGKLRVIFFGLHLNSTDGDTVFALDLTQRQFVRLSPNWAAPFPLPGDAAFLTWTENRYVPIPQSSKTANCSYLERWDAALHKVRYARENTAALCYGASLYRAAKTPSVVIIAGQE